MAEQQQDSYVLVSSMFSATTIIRQQFIMFQCIKQHHKALIGITIILSLTCCRKPVGSDK